MTQALADVPSFRIAADPVTAAQRFNRNLARRRAHIPDFIQPADAERLRAALEALDRWNVVTTSRGRHLDLDARGVAAFDDEVRRKFVEAVHAPATRGFQYLFENFPIYDAYHAGTIPDGAIREIFEFLNSPPLLDFVRQATGMKEIAFADAQATRYRAGHFLTEHNDDIEGKSRCAAYVFNLTSRWRADWGGLLMFPGDDGHIEEAFTPAFNALNIFAVPQRHFVSMVSPFADGARLSITGWFRSGADPMKTQRPATAQ